MFARAHSGTVLGVQASPVIVEANKAKGLPGLTMIGLARGAVREAIVRVRSALIASGVPLGTKKMVVNLLPAELPKEGSALDLPIALSLLVAAEILPEDILKGRRFYGELSLGGGLEEVCGAILVADLAKQLGDTELIVPKGNGAEACLIPGIKVREAVHLKDILDYFRLGLTLEIALHHPSPRREDSTCLSEVRGHTRVKRALEIAVAGGHNLLLVGPPGSGKSMLAKAVPSLLPALNTDELIELTRIHSVAGRLSSGELMGERPFRAPHHTSSEVALCGGGNPPKPGEITLAHRGVLFLDEFPEFSRRALETLREPLEENLIRISRAGFSVEFPSELMLVAAMNPCPCGFYPYPTVRQTENRGSCLCSWEQLMRYHSKISGPILDRIDLHVWVDQIPLKALLSPANSETSEQVRNRVNEAREFQLGRRGKKEPNAALKNEEIQTVLNEDPSLPCWLESLLETRHLSARAIFRMAKVARTIADLNQETTVRRSHFEEALMYRGLDELLDQ